MDIKSVFLGSPFVGKSSLLYSLSNGNPYQNIKPSTMLEIEYLYFKTDSGDIKFRMCNIPCRDSYLSLIHTYIRESNIFVIVFSSDEFECVDFDIRYFYEIIRDCEPEEMPKFIVVRHKCDLDNEFNRAEVASFCREIHAAYFETSVNLPNTIKRFEAALKRISCNSDFDELVNQTITQLESGRTDVLIEPIEQTQVAHEPRNNAEQRHIVLKSNADKDKSCI